MQLHPAVPFPAEAHVPGMTPATAQVAANHRTVIRTATSSGPADGDRAPVTAPKAQHAVLEFLEDVLLLLLVVLAFPAVIMLLALPLTLIVRIAAEIGRRWA